MLILFGVKATGIKFHKNSRIKMSLEIKVTNCWKGRKILPKKCNFVQKLYKNCSKNLQFIAINKKKNVNKGGRWEAQNRAVVSL